MGKITNLKQQVKRKDRVSVYVDGKYSFSLSTWQLGSVGISLGDEITKKQINEFKEKSEFGKLYDRTLMWLMLRPRSHWEVEDYLNRKSDNEASKKEILKRLDEKGYVNDRVFAERWIESRRLLKKVSKLKLRQELIKKRVPKEIIEESINADEISDLDVVKELITKKRKISRYQDDQKLMAYLARQGFSYGTIKQALDEE
jgi:regulatory protein